MLTAESNLRTPVLHELLASDATPSHAGGASAWLGRRRGAALYRAAETRGNYVRLDWQSRGEPPPPVDSQARRARAAALVRSLAWGHARGAPLKGLLHINLQEARAWVWAPRGALQAGEVYGLGRLMVLVDSQVVGSAAREGRSSSKALNRHLRQLGALSLSWDIVAEIVLVSSAANPADAPTCDYLGAVAARAGRARRGGGTRPRGRGTSQRAKAEDVDQDALAEQWWASLLAERARGRSAPATAAGEVERRAAAVLRIRRRFAEPRDDATWEYLAPLRGVRLSRRVALKLRRGVGGLPSLRRLASEQADLDADAGGRTRSRRSCRGGSATPPPKTAR